MPLFSIKSGLKRSLTWVVGRANTWWAYRDAGDGELDRPANRSVSGNKIAIAKVVHAIVKDFLQQYAFSSTIHKRKMLYVVIPERSRFDCRNDLRRKSSVFDSVWTTGIPLLGKSCHTIYP